MFVFREKGYDYTPSYSYGSDDFNVAIPIYHENDHFNGVRRAGAMFRYGYKYCFSCLTTYRRDMDHTHSCKARCINCGRVGMGRPCQPQTGFTPINCQKCDRIFVSDECYRAHLAEECRRNKRCKNCGVIWSVKHNTRDQRGGHVCGEARCQKCNKWHSTKVGCYIQPYVIKHRDHYRLVTYDFECTQHEQLIEENAPIRQLHQVNFISAKVTCTRCLENGKWRQPFRAKGNRCHICGPYRDVCFSVRPFTKTKVDWQQQSEEPLRDFLDWMLYKLKPDHKTMAYSHFGGKYDMVIAFEEIYKRGLVPRMIRRGNKMYEMHVPKVAMPVNTQRTRGDSRPPALLSGEINFHDSYNLLNVALGKLPDAYGLSCSDKPFFPHMANRPENYGRIIPLPPKKDFLFGGMRPEVQAVFEPWYEGEQARGATFNLDEALAEYCCNDVQILTEALVAFREEFMELSRPKNGSDSLPIDILHDAITIASACMKHFRMNHLIANRLAIVPHEGYDRCDNQSRFALQYLSFYGHHHQVHVQTAMSPGGEKRIGKYKLDGYIAERDYGIEVHGCHYHAHECQYSDPGKLLHIGNRPMTVAQIRQRDQERIKYLEEQLDGRLDVVWECEIHNMMRNDPYMDRFMKRCDVPRRLNIRDCFFGGRTGPQRMHYKCPTGYKMGYFDFCSLYPYITATTPYPIGHPKVHIMEGDAQLVRWTRPEDVPVKGVLSVHIVPPEQCAIPVVPVKFRNDDRLLFPLCRTCAMRFKKGAVIPRYSCPHRDPQQRGWESTITSIELEEALAVGYTVDKYFRSYEWEEWDDTVFRGYVAEMMEMKVHASGFPTGIEGKEQEDQFITECMQRFGMKIDRSKMKANKARRAIAKLMANNLWGRFALRNNLTQTRIINCPAEYRSYHENQKLQCNRADQLTPETIMLTYEVLDEFVEENEASNVMISAWTTAAARIKLLREMRKVVDSGAILLYTDTDSLIFAYKEADGCPLKTGWHLGDLTDEYPDYDLLEFVSSGCKAYGIQMQHKVTGVIKIVMRLRGITLTGDVQKRLHFDSFKRCVLKFGERALRMEEEGIDEQEILLLDDLSQLEAEQPNEEDWTIEVEYPNFVQASIAHGRVTSRRLVKRYRPIVTKGIVTSGLIIKDFGGR